MKRNAVCALVLSAVLAFGMFSGCQKKNEGNNPGGNTIIASSETGDFLALQAVDSYHTKIVNGSGMSGSDGKIHLHSALSSDMVKDDYGDFAFDIGHIEKLGEFHVWNYNATGKTEYGLKDIKVYLSEDGENYTLFNSYELKKADGEDGQKATNLVDGKAINFSGAVARFIKISASSNYGGEFYGLSEV